MVFHRCVKIRLMSWTKFFDLAPSATQLIDDIENVWTDLGNSVAAANHWKTRRVHFSFREAVSVIPAHDEWVLLAESDDLFGSFDRVSDVAVLFEVVLVAPSGNIASLLKTLKLPPRLTADEFLRREARRFFGFSLNRIFFLFRV